MKRWKITFIWATKEMNEGEEPWTDIRDSSDDYVEADDADEAIELYRDYLMEEADCRCEEGENDKILFYDDYEDDENYHVALDFQAERYYESRSVKDVLDCLDRDEYTDIEVYRYTNPRFKQVIHHGYIESVELDEEDELFDYWSFEIMDEIDYNESVLANTDNYFTDFYEKDDKILVIMVR